MEKKTFSSLIWSLSNRTFCQQSEVVEDTSLSLSPQYLIQGDPNQFP